MFEAMKEGILFGAFLIGMPVVLWVLCEWIAVAVRKWKGDE